MKIQTQPLADHQVKLIVEVDPEKVEEAKHRAARKLSKQTRIPGFRPGKAPFNVIQRLIGDQKLIEEGVEALVKDLYPQLLTEAQVKPYGPGRIDNIPSWNPLVIEFIVPLDAEVVLGDYRSIRYPYELKSVEDADVERVLIDLQNRQAVDEPVDRPAQEGDHVSVRLSGKRSQPKEGESESLIAERTMAYVIPPEDSESDTNWPFPGFSRNLIGLSAGEEKTILYTFPPESDFESLRGVEAVFWVKVEAVKSHTVPALTDEFAKSVGEYATMQDLNAIILKDLEQHARDEYHSVYDTRIVDDLITNATISFPPEMLTEEQDELIRNLESRLKSQKLDLSTYLKTQNLDESGLRDQLRPAAEQRLKRTLVLSKIASTENIKVSEDEVQSEAERTLEAMTRFMSPAELRKMPMDNLLPNLVGNIMAEMRIQKSLEFLRSIARGEAETVAVESEEVTAEESIAASTAEIAVDEPVIESLPQPEITAEEQTSADAAQTGDQPVVEPAPPDIQE